MTATHRPAGWQTRLQTFITERQHAPFAWGTNDCCLFAADAVLALMGQDFAGDMRGSYSTALEAARQLKLRGGVRAVATAALGEPVSPKRARVGDVVLVLVDGQEALGLCNGSSVLGPAAAGIGAYGMDAALAAWRVG